MSNILTNNINPRSGNLITIGGANDRVSIAGTLSYEDVTNIDSVGIITARDGLDTPTNLVLRTGGTEQARIDSSGNFGIGTTSPSTPLHIKGAADSYLILQAGTTDGNDGILFQNSAGAQKGVIFFDTDNDYMLFSTNNTERLRIDSAGVVNIQYGAIVQAATLGRGPGNVSTNTVFGDNALRLNTTAGQNTAIGYETLYNNITTTANTAIGHQALFNNIASNSTAAGINAMYANTTGIRNTAFGSYALDANTTANDSTAVGYEALTSLNAGNSCTAVGSKALEDCTGSDNTAVGQNACKGNTSGIYNTGVGRKVLEANTNGSYNTAVGGLALDTMSGASNNTCIGYNAGGGITSGGDNTCIGFDAGRSITTGGNNVIIGDGTDPGAGNAGQRIVIGNNIDGVGDNYFTFGKASHRVYNQFTSNASWTRSSDVRLKKDIETNNNLGLAFIKELRTVTYKWKAPSELDPSLADYNANVSEADFSEKMYGFIAQEVKASMDNHNGDNFAGWHVGPEDVDEIQGVSYEMFVVPLVKAVQELSEENAALKARLDAAGL